MNRLIESIHTELLSGLQIESVDPHNPVQVHHIPNPWRLIGAGNYAAVVYHLEYPDQVVKIYAPGRPGFEEEVEVYRRLGSHPAFSECLYAGEGFLVLKRLQGVTLYDCMHFGLQIPKQVIQDIDSALNYARSRGLYPHDVHGRNVMMLSARGLVVDVSDFLHEEPIALRQHNKNALTNHRDAIEHREVISSLEVKLLLDTSVWGASRVSKKLKNNLQINCHHEQRYSRGLQKSSS